MQREVKDLNNKTHMQENARIATSDIKRQVKDRRNQTEILIKSIKTRHLIQIRQFTASEERRVVDTKALLEIQCKGLSKEQRSSADKEFNSKIAQRQVCF